MKIYKYQATGNDFIMIDDRKNAAALFKEEIIHLCDRRYGIGADGIILLKESSFNDFKMEFYNNDGSHGMMCGNGGRCIIALADELGIKPKKSGSSYIFDSPVGTRRGRIDGRYPLRKKLVTLYMGDVCKVEKIDGMYRLNTGAEHLVIFCEDADAVDVIREGRRRRYDKRFAERGINVNFVQISGDNLLKVRTYEQGVEEETYSCGTGVIAASIAARLKSQDGGISEWKGENEICEYEIRAVRDTLKVRFRHNAKAGLFQDIEIQGETQLVFTAFTD